jgi:hypothetical protein
MCHTKKISAALRLFKGFSNELSEPGFFAQWKIAHPVKG